METTRKFHRSTREAFPIERAYAVEGPYKRTHSNILWGLGLWGFVAISAGVAFMIVVLKG